jgi:hypothetical protein
MIYYILLFVAALVLIATVAIGTHIGIQHKRFSLHQPKLQQYLEAKDMPTYDLEVVDVFRPLTEPNEIFKAWYQALQLTQHEAWFSTYVWHFHPVDELNVVTPHIYIIGRALKKLDETLDHPVTVNFLVNQSTWLMSNLYINSQWRNTFDLWKKIGFEGKFVQVNVRIWKHKSLNNIHGKLLLIDDREAILSSINIEQESYGGKRSWYESGTWITHTETTQQLKSFLKTYWDQSTIWVRYNNEKSVKQDLKVGWYSRNNDQIFHDLEQEMYNNTWPEITHVGNNTVCDEALAGMYHTDHLKASPITRGIVDLLLRAEHTIDILTPTFNHPIVWNTLIHVCKRNPKLKVRIMMGWGFNVDSPLAQKHLLGFPTNAVFVKDKLNHPQITWKWYGHEGKLVHRHSGRMCHAKVIIVDNMYGKSSSFNLDTWSSLNSMEVAFFFENQQAANHYTQNLFETRWRQGILINNNTIHDSNK